MGGEPHAPVPIVPEFHIMPEDFLPPVLRQQGTAHNKAVSQHLGQPSWLSEVDRDSQQRIS